MHIEKVLIENFKCFKGQFKIELYNGLNILVGDNESGKSTILEAIHLALTGLMNGRYLRNELTQYIFNNEIVLEYIKSLKNDNTPIPPPYILIEIYFAGDDMPLFEGDGNFYKKKGCGVSLKILFDDKYQSEYEEFVKSEDINTIPIEYYDISMQTFAREQITTKSIPIKSALIDSSSYRYQNGSDVYISRIIRDNLDDNEIINIKQSYRKIQEMFVNEEGIKKINSKIKKDANISDKDIKLSVDLSSKNAWETSLMTYLDDVPFHHVGKGEQCIVKTKLALSHCKAKEANLILLEEPENHLSHSKLNQFLYDLETTCGSKQILISTHSSFVVNKLGLERIILLNNSKTIRLSNLKKDTVDFFKKLSGYDTLRLILCKKAVLVEGDSDDLIVQKAYLVQNNKRPIEDNIDVIRVGTSFLRFLEIADKIEKPVVVVTDNDGDVDALKKKYEEYLGDIQKKYIKICFDGTNDKGHLKIGDRDFNYNTLEPKILKSNSLKKLNKVFKTSYTDINEMHKYMRSNKTECALKIFDTSEGLNFPDYILESIK
jgi:putative ATP-dependent endonuclease of the OLD family